MMPDLQGGPLEGLLVADFSRVLAGPLATMMLGDLGADVVKVEHPATGDETRAWGPPFASDGESTYYLSVNRNKRSVLLNLDDCDDGALARNLVSCADVVVETFRPHVMRRFNLTYEDVAAINPGVVYASITAFGGTDAAINLPGYDLLIQAMSGLMHITGEPDGDPVKVGVALTDVMTGLYTVVGILAALNARSNTGRGQHLSVSLFDTALAGLTNQASACVAGGVNPGRLGNHHPSIVPYQSFHAADRPFVVAVGNDRLFAKLCEVIERSELALDERFSTNQSRIVHREELTEYLSEALAKSPADEWIDAFTAVGIPAGPINSLAEAFDFAAQLGTEPVVTTRRNDGTDVPTVRSPLRLSGSPVSVRRPPPRLGEHNDEIRAWLRGLG